MGQALLCWRVPCARQHFMPGVGRKAYEVVALGCHVFVTLSRGVEHALDYQRRHRPAATRQAVAGARVDG